MARIPTPEYRGLLNARADAREKANRLYEMAGRAAGPAPSELIAAMVAEEAAEEAVDSFDGQRYEEDGE